MPETNYVDPAPDRHDRRHVRGWLYFVFGLILLALVLTYFLNWADVGLNTMSGTNVKRLSQEANNQHQALIGMVASMDNATNQLEEFETLYGTDRAIWPQGKREEYQQLSAQQRNQVTAYNASCSQYNALWQDEWRAVPAPPDLPTTCQLR